MKYSSWYVQEFFDTKAGQAAALHAAESGHEWHFQLTYQTVTCGHLACEPGWTYSTKEEDE